ncbi:uncharacterized protein KIAA1958 isoform X1 [Brienomyrus brachyistius]|uniref:uncharacterized protein KIAA1958 isoform X1 n=1 Tax=Brienomyrus brachyistius TaxID=42636 RepID=UPI0020B23438|nr:uncharacterized protein KIAA1958 isoform X1 [Brienomyrus brachyistius]
MPRLPKVPKEKIVQIILERKSEVVKDGRIAVPSDKVWRELSQNLNGVISPKALYTLVKRNGYNVCQDLGVEYVQTKQEPDQEESDETDDSSGEEYFEGAETTMDDYLQTSAEDLSKLVSWAHSHGTICTVIPGLKHLLSGGSHGHLTAMWGCSAGHAYHWTLTAACGSRSKESVSEQDGHHGAASGMPPGSGERILGRASKVETHCVQVSESCDISNCSDPSEMDDNTEEYSSTLLDAACESSATDEDGDYERQLRYTARKRGSCKLSQGQAGFQRSEEGLWDSGVKKIKQEMPEDYYTVLGAQLTGSCDSGPSSLSVSRLGRQVALPHPPGMTSRLHMGGHKPPVTDPNAESPPHSPLPTSAAKALCGSAPCGQSRLLGNVASPSPVDALQRLDPGPSSGCSEAAHSPLAAMQLGGHAELMETVSSEDLMKCDGASLPYGDAEPSSATSNPELDVSGEPSAETSGSPTLFEIEKLKVLLQAEKKKSELMEETIKGLKQDKTLLQQELTKKAELICDFLQDQLSHRPEKRRPHVPSQPEPSGSSQHSGVFPDESVSFESPVLFDSFDEMDMRAGERQKTIKSSRKSREGENTRVRMKNVVGVIARYMTALQEFRRSVSMRVAFDRVGVDRNTISRTAAIAELSLAAPEVFHSLAPWDEKEETLAHYAIRCRQAMDDNIKAKIKVMKANGDLLPIVSK